MPARTEAYQAGMTRNEAYLALTNTDPMTKRPMASSEEAMSALRVVAQEGAWWCPKFAILHWKGEFAIVKKDSIEHELTAQPNDGVGEHMNNEEVIYRLLEIKRHSEAAITLINSGEPLNEQFDNELKGIAEPSGQLMDEFDLWS